MPQDFYPGRKHNWDDASNAFLYIDLEDAAAQGIRIQEYVTGQSSPSIEVENNAGTTVFRVLASATDSNSITLVASTTTGNSISVTCNSLTTGSGLSVNSSATAITGAGRLLEVFHTGATSTSGVIAEISSVATDETVVCRITATAALEAGVVLDVSGVAVTTGTLLDASNADALTTGKIANFVSDSADTSTRTLVNIHNDNSAAVNATPLVITQDAVTSTNFKLVATLQGMALYVSDQTTPNGALTAAEGSLCLNGSATGQAFWNTDGSTAWTALA